MQTARMHRKGGASIGQQLPQLRLPVGSYLGQVDLLGCRFGQRFEEGLFVVEVAVEAHRPHVELLGDPPHAQGTLALALDQTDRCIENQLLRKAGLVFNVLFFGSRLTHVYGVLYGIHAMSGRGRVVIRRLAWAAILGQLAFVVSWVTAGALQRGYSPWRQGVSDLTIRHASHAWIVTVGLIAVALSYTALIPGLREVLPARPATQVAALLFLLATVGLTLAALFPLDCAPSSHVCRARLDAGALSWQSSAHLWLSWVASVALVATPFALARALWPGPVAVASLAAGGFGLLVVVGGQLAYTLSAPQGITERLQLLAGHLWVVLVAGGILHATRVAIKTAPLTPVRSRQMFAASWAGEGAFSAWPAPLGRLIRARFELSRTTRFLSEEMWMFDDVALFPGGRILTQRLICSLEPTGRIHVTSDGVPGGADVLLEDRGYRLTPYRYLVPIGPLHLTVRCREEHRVQPDGSLLGAIKVRWLRLPIGVLSWRAWRTDQPPHAEPSSPDPLNAAPE